MFLVKSDQLVRGDLIFLSVGDMVPCDSRIVEADELLVLQSNITGDIKPVKKDPDFLRYTHDISPAHQENMLFASSIIVKGSAKAIVCCIGDENLVCKLDKNKPIVSEKNVKSISFFEKFSKFWSLLMVIIVFLTVFLGVAFAKTERSLLDFFITGLSLAVSIIGEYFTVSSHVIVANGLFSSVKQDKSFNSGALIKNVSKIDDLKKITCLLVHKEGAFSLRSVKAEKVFVNNNVYSDGEVNFKKNAERLLKFALVSTGLYGAGKLVKNNLKNENIYSSEEDAIISLAQKYDIYNINLDNDYPILDHISKGVDSRFETTLTIHNNDFIAICKGNLDEILFSCSHYCENGNIYQLDPEKKSEYVAEASKLSRQSYRLIAVASKVTNYNSLKRIGACQTDMVFEGIVALREQILPGVAKNISDCKAAGIKIIMLCDDIGEHNIKLAEAIGVVKNREEAVSGEDLNMLGDDMFHTNIQIYRLYQRLSIFQKRKLLDYLKKDGETIGVLAGELDEIILLKDADVGFIQRPTLSGKMDKNGVDMTQNASSPLFVKRSKDSRKTGSEALKFIADVIISDASTSGDGGFNAMISSIVASKCISNNLSKIFKYVIMSQSVRLIIAMYGLLSGHLIINNEQILFSGLIIDFFAVIIFAFDQHKKIGIKTSTLDKVSDVVKKIPMSILASFVWSGTLIFLPLLLGLVGINAYDRQITITFISLILSQLTVIEQVLRDNSVFVKGIRYSRAHIVIVVLTFFMLCSAVFIPFIGNVIGITQINWLDLLFAFIPSVIMLITFEIHKLIHSK